MYMPGRLRTASRPSRTVMEAVPYSAGDLPLLVGLSSFSIDAGSPPVLSTRAVFCSRKVWDSTPVRLRKVYGNWLHTQGGSGVRAAMRSGVFFGLILLCCGSP